jgi:hypothetical protein
MPSGKYRGCRELDNNCDDMRWILAIHGYLFLGIDVCSGLGCSLLHFAACLTKYGTPRVANQVSVPLALNV